jgi:hypothetical protein
MVKKLDPGSQTDGAEDHLRGDLEHNLVVIDNVGGEEVETRLFGNACPGGQHDLVQVLAEDFGHRRASDLADLLELEEQRRFQDTDADKQPDEDQQSAQKEGNAPAPGEERIVPELPLHKFDRARRTQQSQRHAGLGPAGIEAALTTVAVFQRQQDRSAPFTADAHTLENAQEYQDQGRGHADLIVGGQYSNQERAHTHEKECGHQSRFAPDAISQVAEERPSNGPGDEPERKRPEGEEPPEERIVRGKE